METENHVHSDLAIPPGEYLEEVLEELGMTKKELAARMNRPASKLNGIYKGKKEITEETAIQLEQVVGVPAHIWTGLESEYRLTLARQREKAERERCADESLILGRFPYADLAKLGVVPKTRRKVEKVLALRNFFGVTDLRNLDNLPRYSVALRSSRGRTPSRGALASWLRVGERKAHETNCPPFDKKRLEKALAEIREMTRKPPEEYFGQLEKILRDCGVVLAMCPELPKTYVNGAVFWIGKQKAVLMMTIRGKWADIFWFSLFHEIGHILLHGKELIIDWNLGTDGLSDIEIEADTFAQRTLIPEKSYESFVGSGQFTKGRIVEFSTELGVSPGIIVGRLQHEKRIPWSWCNDLRTKHEWAAGLET